MKRAVALLLLVGCTHYEPPMPAVSLSRTRTTLAPANESRQIAWSAEVGRVTFLDMADFSEPNQWQRVWTGTSSGWTTMSVERCGSYRSGVAY